MTVEAPAQEMEQPDPMPVTYAAAASAIDSTIASVKGFMKQGQGHVVLSAVLLAIMDRIITGQSDSRVALDVQALAFNLAAVTETDLRAAATAGKERYGSFSMGSPQGRSINSRIAR